MSVYSADKVWKQMNRENIPVAHCPVERLMKQLGIEGVRRGRQVRTTIPDSATIRPLDRVNRPFKTDRPNQLGCRISQGVDLARCGPIESRVTSSIDDINNG